MVTASQKIFGHTVIPVPSFQLRTQVCNDMQTLILSISIMSLWILVFVTKLITLACWHLIVKAIRRLLVCLQISDDQSNKCKFGPTFSQVSLSIR